MMIQQPAIQHIIRFSFTAKNPNTNTLFAQEGEEVGNNNLYLITVHRMFVDSHLLYIYVSFKQFFSIREI